MNIKFKDKNDMLTFLRLLRMRTDTRVKAASKEELMIFGSLFYRALELIDRVLVDCNEVSEEQLLTFVEIIKDLDYAHTPGTKAKPIEIERRAEIIRELFNRLELFASTLPEEKEKVEFKTGDKVQLTPEKNGEVIPFPSLEVRREGSVIEDNSRLEPIVISRKSETPRVEPRYNNPSRDETRVKKSVQKVETTNNPSRDRFVSLDEHGRGYTEYNLVDGRLVPPQPSRTQVVIAAHSSQEQSRTQERYTIPEFMRTKPIQPVLDPLLGTKRMVEHDPQSEREQMKIYANKIGSMVSSFKDDQLLEQHKYMFDCRDYKLKPYWKVRIPRDMVVRYENKSEKFIRNFSRLSSRLTDLAELVVKHISATYGKVDDLFTMKTIYDYLLVIYKAKVEVKKLYNNVKNFDMMNTALASATSMVESVEMYFYDQEMPGIKGSKGVSKS